jgi:DNA-binding winged helix-turn-helix (wHTH) protein
MMLAYHFVQLIETHSDDLADKLLDKVRESSSTRAYSNVPPRELKQRVYEIYEHLGDWLLGKKDVDIERRYREIGVRRCHQQVPLCELIWAIVLTKQNLWEFLTWESMADRPVRVFGELEVLQMLDQFFDRAIIMRRWATSRRARQRTLPEAGWFNRGKRRPSMPETCSPRLARFEDFEVDLLDRELRKHGLGIKLQESALQVLEMLAEHPGVVVTREELQKKLWPASTSVDFEACVDQAIDEVRKALGDSPDRPRFIEVLDGRGYRFTVPVEWPDTGTTQTIGRFRVKGEVRCRRNGGGLLGA